MSYLSKISSSTRDFLVDTLIAKGPSILVAALGAGGMGYLAKISAKIEPYGAVAWGGVTLVSFVMICCSLALLGVWLQKKSIAAFTGKMVETASVNPLEPLHKNKRIQLADFFHPFYKPSQNLRFEECDLMGPVNLYAEGGAFHDCGFIDCEIIIVRDDRPIRGVVPMKHPTFLKCSLYRVTLLMPFSQYNTLPEPMKKGVSVISDGRVGDI